MRSGIPCALFKGIGLASRQFRDRIAPSGRFSERPRESSICFPQRRAKLPHYASTVCTDLPCNSCFLAPSHRSIAIDRKRDQLYAMQTNITWSQSMRAPRPFRTPPLKQQQLLHRIAAIRKSHANSHHGHELKTAASTQPECADWSEFGDFVDWMK